MRAYMLSFLLLAGSIAGQSDCPSPCHDVSPEANLPCGFYSQLNQCEDDILKDAQGRFAFCFCTCGRCTDGSATQNVPPEPNSMTPSSDNFAVITGKAVSVSEIKEAIATAVAQATAEINQTLQDNVDANIQEQAVAAAQASAEVVATAIATAFAATEITAITAGDNSQAQGEAAARAESIANATAEAYAAAFARTGEDFVFLEALTLESEVNTALVASYSQVAISGDAEATAVNQAVATSVAEVIAEATASAFARYAEGEAQAIGRAVAASDVSECPSTCNDNPPPDETGSVLYTCEQQRDWGKCDESYMSGYCECICGTCGSDAAGVDSSLFLQTGDNGEATGIAAGQADAGTPEPAEDASGCPCNDDPPPDESGIVQYTCQQQKDWGKCEESYMSGYCECTCGVCGQSAQKMTMPVDVSNCPEQCNDDAPPDESGEVLYTCEDQKRWGKCTESYMVGYCECTCGTCVV
eukprot:TRINITY_DN2800_c0_g1_i1.p2 TRINITY_DN2800_c0_g1~~TRINITY_DN2800_c0_g1_i1.p2  ORF type:complete len:471 (-),score=88.17 TRINITY_DN2800_c0_g1_i1:375-1787(-)